MSEKKVSLLLPKYKYLESEYDAVVRCNRCGFCDTICPTYTATGKETLSPRGRNQAFRNILEGTLQNPKEASNIFSTCLTCHACTRVCFSEVPVGSLMGAAREISEASLSSNLTRWILRAVLIERRVLSVILWLAFIINGYSVRL